MLPEAIRPNRQGYTIQGWTMNIHKITNLYATILGYDKDAKITKLFFRTYRTRCIGQTTAHRGGTDSQTRGFTKGTYGLIAGYRFHNELNRSKIRLIYS